MVTNYANFYHLQPLKCLTKLKFPIITHVLTTVYIKICVTPQNMSQASKVFINC